MNINNLYFYNMSMKSNEKETIYGNLLNTADKYPNNIAVIDDDKSYTFTQLNQMICQIYESMPKNCRRALIIMDHGVKMVASMFAVLKKGAAYVPVEPDFPIERIRMITKEVKPCCILSEKNYIQKLNSLNETLLDVSQMKWDWNKKGNVLNNSLPSSPAYILYTSGTTGRPKGVEVTNANICNYVKAFEKEFHTGPEDIMLQSSVCTFDIYAEEVFTTLLNGGTLAIPTHAARNDFHQLMEYADKHKCTILSGFPYLIEQMNDEKILPKSFRLLVSGGDVLRKDYIENIKDKVSIYNTYGPSETTICCSYYDAGKGYSLKDGTYPVGKPVYGVSIQIEDEKGNSLKPGMTGEIVIYGSGVSNGYIGDHELENKAFRFDEKKGRSYHSGDLGYLLEDGNIAFLHRKDKQIMIFGKRVEPDEVENVMNSYPNTKMAAVLVTKDEKNLSHMHAFVVFKDEDKDIDGLKEFMSRYLTSFMIPEKFSVVKDLPRTDHGKIDYRKLAEL